jgi:septum site-determining protein MinC
MSIQNSSKQIAAAFELKGRMMTLSVLHVLMHDLDALKRQLDAKIMSAPGLFKNLPVLLDFDALAESQEVLDVAELNRLLRERGLIPVGVRGAGERLTEASTAAGLGIINSGAAPELLRREPAKETKETAASAPPLPGLFVRQPIRSGQQVYARGGDLVVLAAVSPGAEILADGHIHVYGPLRGRALAGVRGNTEARIFCQSLDAELISIAGNYRVSENIQDSERGQPVQIFLDGDSLRIDPL